MNKQPCLVKQLCGTGEHCGIKQRNAAWDQALALGWALAGPWRRAHSRIPLVAHVGVAHDQEFRVGERGALAGRHHRVARASDLADAPPVVAALEPHAAVDAVERLERLSERASAWAQPRAWS